MSNPVQTGVILVTGGSGMLGQNLLPKLEKAYPNAKVLAPSSSELNLLDAQGIQHYLLQYRPDAVIHTAGKVGGIQANIADPSGFLYHNVMMGMNLLNACVNAEIRSVINIGSSCMYPKDVEGLLRESMILSAPLEPTNEGYALAKITVARYARFLSEQFESLQYKTLIPCNLFGAWDNFHPQRSHMLPAIIRKIDTALQQGENRVLIWGDGTARREFMDARDLADAIIFALQNIDILPHELNIGLGHDYAVLEYYQRVAQVLGYSGGFDFDLSKPTGMKQKLMDVSKVNALGWQAQISLEAAVASAHDFYKSTVLKKELQESLSL